MLSCELRKAAERQPELVRKELVSEVILNMTSDLYNNHHINTQTKQGHRQTTSRFLNAVQTS